MSHSPQPQSSDSTTHETPVDSADAPQETRPDNLSRSRLWLFRICSIVLIPVVILAGLEIGFRLTTESYPTGFLLPASSKAGHLRDNFKFGWRFFPKALSRNSQPIMVTAAKPAETKRVVVFGGSAAMGDPEPAYGLPRVLKTLLEIRYPNDKFEVINAAVTAINSHVVLPITKDCRQLDADAWVVYMGNNEVLGPFGAGGVFQGRETPLWLIRAGLAFQRTSIGQFSNATREKSNTGTPDNWRGMEMFLDYQLRHNSKSLERVYNNFKQNLKGIIKTAQGAETPILISSIVTNLRDCAPFASLHRETLGESELAAWEELFDEGCTAQDLSQFNEALEAYQRAMEIDPDFAELPFRRGECLLALGKVEEAREQFELAKELDTLRFRAVNQINEIIASTTKDQDDPNVRFVDACENFANASDDGIPGSEFLHEHVHFNFDGNYLLACVLADQLVDLLDLEENPDAQVDWPSADECAVRLGLTPYHRALVAQEMRGRLQTPPFNTQITHQRDLARLAAEESRWKAEMTGSAASSALDNFRNLLESDPNDTVLRAQFSMLLESTGDIAGATEQWMEISLRFPHSAEAFFRLGALFNREKKWNQAEQALSKALAIRPSFARALNSLGICLSHLQKFDESCLRFSQAVALRPEFGEAYLNWGQVLASQGKERDAIERYAAAIEANPDYLPAHVRLAKYYVRQQDFTAAEPFYRAVARLRPDNSGAATNLGVLYMRLKQRTKAIEQLTRALKLDPTNDLAERALAQARQLPK
ncbi:MAG: tetratricopeptide repeat protein [Planctomycetaceae bacterium]|nr:tetratricopeptide repeat protein [Planctomycetaceae bacterium]